MKQAQIEYHPVPGIVERTRQSVKRTCLTLGFGALALAWFDDAKLDGRIRQALLSEPHGSVAHEVMEDLDQHAAGDNPEAEAMHILENRFGIPRPVWITLAKRESGQGMSMFATRFEPHILPKVKHLSPDPHEQRWLASSHGRFQVMGFHVPRIREKYGVDITPEGLSHDVRQNALAAGIILSECFRDRRVQGVKQQREKLRGLFECYNGAGPQARAYADAAMRELGQEILNDLEINIQPAHDEIKTPTTASDIRRARK